jgi:hypothetical protein
LLIVLPHSELEEQKRLKVKQRIKELYEQKKVAPPWLLLFTVDN